ncbi:D-hexose-6-phosphate mutarotase [Methylibium rhizosphaerae]|uniref:D-hexose-6-phosphate mutarotase n=1 Tax=Methylibium rhizosphaerae TaxID=2570323 RepID=UPI001FEB575D|nr:D-hexose-6-phosphate mutarotase [Methylibium rhizosphaerae]
MDEISSVLTRFNGRSAVALQAPDGAQAVLLLQGAQLVSWRARDGRERLYLSDSAVYADGQAVRGGVPVVFPQFEKRGPLQRHGFARVLPWTLERADVSREGALAVLRLESSDITLAQWPHRFAAELTVNVSNERLDVELEVENTGDAPLSFTAALHTYLRVHEVEEASLEGLRGQTYLDSLTGREAMQGLGAVTVEDEVDRIYWGHPEHDRTLLLREPGRTLAIDQQNFPDTVVWNPWTEKALAMADLPPSDFRRFLCVEAAAIGEPVQLAAGEAWWGRQTLRTQP